MTQWNPKSTLLVAACSLAIASQSVTANEAADSIIDSNSVGGTAGYLVKRLNSSVIDSQNPNTTFYPASSIKVVEHLAAMKLVEEGKMFLDTLTLNICNDDENCEDGPNEESGCELTTNDLRGALSVMMVNSGNKTTNAVQEYVGRAEYLTMFNPAAAGRSYMNYLGHDVIGYSDSLTLNHKFACGNVSNNPANVATLSDFSTLYEAIGSREDVIAVPTRLEMKTLMLNESNGFFTGALSNVISQEAADLGKSLIVEDFSDRVRLIYKPGSLSTGYLSVAGMIQLPINNGTGKRIYTFSSFFNDADIVINSSQMAVSAEILRPAIRSALQSWVEFTQPGFGYLQSNQMFGTLNIIEQDMPDAGSKQVVAAAASEMEQVAQLLSNPLPDNYAAAVHLVDALGYMDKAVRYDTEGNVERVRREMVSLIAHLADNAVATAHGESLDPNLQTALRTLASNRTTADYDYHRDALQQAANGYTAIISDATALVTDPTGGGCPAYSEEILCPEHVSSTVGF